jgi:hypothetical protein
MDLKFLSRRKFLGVGAVATVGAALAPQDVFAGDEEVELLRWDLITISQHLVLPGSDKARDAATGDVVTLTGSGEVEPKKGAATGGGTFVHRHADGTEVAHGVYRVTGFQSFTPAGGHLAAPGVADGIGTLDQTMGGLLTLHVELSPSGGGTLAGVLEVDCTVKGIEFPIEEGVNLSVGSFNFEKAGGFTLFHVLHGVNQN